MEKTFCLFVLERRIYKWRQDYTNMWVSKNTWALHLHVCFTSLPQPTYTHSPLNALIIWGNLRGNGKLLLYSQKDSWEVSKPPKINGWGRCVNVARTSDNLSVPSSLRPSMVWRYVVGFPLKLSRRKLREHWGWK